MWTQFWDMHSGGGTKEPPYEKIYIEAPEDEAAIIFYNRFGHNPYRVTCTCCGDDYSLSESETLEEATGYHRGCDYAYFDQDGMEVPECEAWVRGRGLKEGYGQGYVERKRRDSWIKKLETIEEYEAREDVLIIRADEIRDDEREGDLPRQGYVWMD